LEIIFIGTGSGKTSLRRNHSSFIISSSKTKLLVDTGDGISRALIQSKIKFNSISAIIITHFHPDHLGGLPSLLNQMKMKGRNEVLNIFSSGNPGTLKDYIETNLIFLRRLGFEINLKLLSSGDEIKVNEEISFKVKQNTHLDKYKNEVKHGGKILGSLSLLFSIRGKKIFYSGDVGSANDLYLFNEKIDLIIAESTHLHLNELLEAVKNINPRKLILTHIDDNMVKDLNERLQKFDEKIRKKIFIAFDNYKLRIR